MEGIYQQALDKFLALKKSPVFLQPYSIIELESQKLDHVHKSMQQVIQIIYEQKIRAFREFVPQFHIFFEKKIQKKAYTFQLLEERLKNFSPLATLKRGYSIVTNTKGKIITRKQDVQKNEIVKAKVSDGEFYAVVKEIN